MPRDLITIGCVSFLNARPLIHGLDGRDDLAVRYDVPSGLLEDLLAGEVDIALCPVIDYQLSPEPLHIVPVGGIGSLAETLTVRLFSRVPIHDIRRVRIDSHSHTSNVLMQIVLRDVYHQEVQIIAPGDADAGDPQALLLIGDKVVNAAPDEADYPHQLDLGLPWQQLTGLPFLFAVWMCRPDAELGHVPELLARQREINAGRLDEIVADWAPRIGWPVELAHRYVSHHLHYAVGPRHVQAMQHFWQRAHELNLTPGLRPLAIHSSAAQV